MRRVAILASIAALTLAVAIGVAQRDAFADLQPTVILVSFDGFRWDYPSKAPMPNLRRLMERGVHARNMIPSFPSKTFPNHYSIVTGLYPIYYPVEPISYSFLRSYRRKRVHSRTLRRRAAAPPAAVPGIRRPHVGR